HSRTQGTNRSKAHGTTTGRSEEAGWTTSVTVAPFHAYHREEITSSRTSLTPEEQTLLAMQDMQDVPQATVTRKVPSHPALSVCGPWVAAPTITKRVVESGLQRVHSLPYDTSVEQRQLPVIDAEARTVPTQETQALPQRSPAPDDEPGFWHPRIADSPAPE